LVVLCALVAPAAAGYCPKGRWMNAAGSCIQCRPGFRCPGDDQHYPCSAGTFAAEPMMMSCHACGAFYYSKDGATECSNCFAPEAEEEMRNSRQCKTESIMGKIENGHFHRGEADLDEAGELDGANPYARCAAGQYHSGWYGCQSCSTGHRCPGDDQMYPCTPGNAQPQMGQASCHQCGFDTFADEGASECSSCEFYVPANSNSKQCSYKSDLSKLRRGRY